MEHTQTHAIILCTSSVCKEKVFVLNLADAEKKQMQAGNMTDAFQHVILKLVLICDHLRAQGIL